MLNLTVTYIYILWWTPNQGFHSLTQLLQGPLCVVPIRMSCNPFWKRILISFLFLQLFMRCLKPSNFKQVFFWGLIWFPSLSRFFGFPTFLLTKLLRGGIGLSKQIPYARHYKPRFVYFLPTFWSSFMYCDLWPYVWLVFKSGF